VEEVLEWKEPGRLARPDGRGCSIEILAKKRRWSATFAPADRWRKGARLASAVWRSRDPAKGAARADVVGFIDGRDMPRSFMLQNISTLCAE
jgi:hypothetical protein